MEALQKKLAEEEAERQRVLAEKRRIEEEKRRAEEAKRLEEEQPMVDDRYEQMKTKPKLAARLREEQDLVSYLSILLKTAQTKYTSTNPLPDPSKETDITTFMTLWKDSKDKDLKEAIERCQIAEEVLRQMQNISGEAMSMYDKKTEAWCSEYAKVLREIEFKKYDEITAKFMEYMDQHTKMTEEEKKAEEAQKKKQATKPGDAGKKKYVEKFESKPDLNFGIFANVVGAVRSVIPVEFGKNSA